MLDKPSSSLNASSYGVASQEPLVRRRRLEEPTLTFDDIFKAFLPQPSAAQKLPADVIREIFSWIFHSRTRYWKFSHSDTVNALRWFLSATFPCNVSRVSRAWRSVALAKPEWWASPAIALHDLDVLRTRRSGLRQRKQLLYEMVGRWLEMCFAKADAAGSRATINGAIRFMGLCEPQFAVHALAPLVQRTSRWGEVGILLDETNNVGNNYGLGHWQQDLGWNLATVASALSFAELPLLGIDLARLQNARALSLSGHIWGVTIPRWDPFGPDGIRPYLPSLSALTTLRLKNMEPSVCVNLIGAAANTLEGLHLTTNEHTTDGWTPRFPIVASRLRKFELVFGGVLPNEVIYVDNIGYVPAPVDAFHACGPTVVHPLLDNVRCEALESLAVIYVEDATPPLQQIANFVKRGGFAQALRKLKVECLTRECVSSAYRLREILARTTQLRSLALLCSPPEKVLVGLARSGVLPNDVTFSEGTVLDEDTEFKALCPLLRELHIRGGKAPAGVYARMLVGSANSVNEVLMSETHTLVSKALFEECFVEEEVDMAEWAVDTKYRALGCVEALGEAGAPGGVLRGLRDAGVLELGFTSSQSSF